MKDYRKTIEKAYGTEPVWGATQFSSKEEIELALHKGVQWYWKKGTKRDHKKWVLDYCLYSNLSKEDINTISHNNIESFSAIAPSCRMISRGAPLDLDTISRIKTEVQALIASGLIILAKCKLTEPVNIQERIETKTREYLIEIDEYVDNAFTACANKTEIVFDPEKWATTKRLKGLHCTKIVGYIQNTYLTEIIEAYNGKDLQLVEAYSFLARPNLKKLIRLLSETTVALQTFAEQQKYNKKPRKNKQKTPSQLAKKCKYMIESTEYKIVSISPDKIVGSTLLVIFNTKYRTLSVYYAKDPRGLSIKGTTVINFDTTKSISNRLRKPNETLNKLKGVRAIQSILGTIKTKPSIATGRINENCIIIGAY